MKDEIFYADYLNGRDSMVTVFEVHRDGIDWSSYLYLSRKEQLQTYYSWEFGGRGGIPGDTRNFSASNNG